MVRDWILKAENDLKIGKDEILTDNPATDAVCFHMQQVVEKYLKAFLVFNNREIRKTHDIAELIEVCKEIDSDFDYLYEIKADKLTMYAVEFRYPGSVLFPSLEETKEAVEIAEKVKMFILEKLYKLGFKIT